MDRNPVTKAFRALRWLIEEPSGSTGVRELAVSLGLPPSGAHRLLSQLVDENMARQDAAGRYALGIEFYRLANIAAAKAPIRQAALVPMRRLVDACNETALLGIYDASRQEMIFVASVESTHELRFVTPLNVWMSVHTGAAGLAIMAFLRADEVGAIVDRAHLTPAGRRAIADRDALAAELARIRERGWASTRGQRTAGAAGLAAPIFNASGEVAGAVVLKMPEGRFDERGPAALLDQLLGCTHLINADIGGARADTADRRRAG